MNGDELVVLILQVGLILGLSRLMGAIFNRLHQPQVMGEIIAGIMLGPSLLGLVFPSAYETFFPPASVQYLQVLSDVGVIFFLFLIGLEFDPELIRRRGYAALVISAASIAVPFALGVGLTFYLYPRVFDEPQQKNFLVSALFMGAAISVTAFPVLARIVSERNLHRTTVGALSITAAAVNDLLAWCMLAVVVGIAQFDGRQSGWPALLTILLAAAYVLFMLFAMKPFLRRLEIVYRRQGRLNQNIVAVIILLVLMSAYATQRIGIHALFGAFLMGVVMPKGSRFVRELSEKLEDFTVVFLLPIFFAYAGLRTDLPRLVSGHLWGYTLLIVALACIGKIGGASLAARAAGQRWRESLAIGTLMNTRGLMELIILTIGLNLGVINQRVFAMMVIMALVTTALTTPLLHLVYPERLLAAAKAGVAKLAEKKFTVLMPIADPTTGGPMLKLAQLLAGSETGRLLALHLRRPAERDAYRAGIDDPNAITDEALQPIVQTAQRTGTTVEPISFVSRDVPDDIAAVARIHQANLVLIGFHRPVIGATMLGGTVHRVLSSAPADVGIFVSRNFSKVARILVPYLGSTHDRLAMELAARVARNSGAKIMVLHVVAPARSDDGEVLGAKKQVDRVFAEPDQAQPVTFRVIESTDPVDAVLRESAGADLIVIGVAEQWGLESALFGWRRERIAQESATSLLIVRRHASESVAASTSAPPAKAAAVPPPVA